MVELHRTGDVFVATMNDGENRFNPTSVAAWNTVLDEVETAAAEPDALCALVTTGTGKFFSNGLDLEWLGAAFHDPEIAEPMAMVADVQHLWARVMSLPVPTVAAVNGHAFAGGAMFALAHDHVLMREDRGFWCVNELLLKMRFTPGMQALLSGRLPIQTARKAILTAHRFNGPEALASGIADALHDESGLLPAAIELAQALSPTAHKTLNLLKEDLFPSALANLRSGAAPDAF
jgi:enoyl-CoA hydratase/carnithine racemase